MGKYYFVGSGIASLAGAAFLIRDGGVLGQDIVIFEESQHLGGAFDARGDAAHGYYMSGSRMFESKYRCTFDLLSSIPSASNPNISIKEETDLAAREVPWFNHARLVDRDGNITDFHELGFNERDRLDLLAIMAKPEHMLDDRSIADCFQPHFFQTNFWFEWCTLFAFEPWHSAIEFKRYLLRFVHHFATIDTQEGVYRTLYNQYDAIAEPLARWLATRGVEFRHGVRVNDLDFLPAGRRITVSGIHWEQAGLTGRVPIAENDKVFVTLGSMTADKRFGATDHAPSLAQGKKAGAWQLWENLARGRPLFGNPSVFDEHTGESAWVSFTATMRDPLFFELMKAFSGSEAGMGGLITFKDSSWLLTLSIYHQPFFRDQPEGTYVWWGYGLFHDRPGDYVKKPMNACTGAEILEEVLGHLHFGAQRERIMADADCIPCLMPYITSQFLVRSGGDRPQVVPPGSTNLAFLGQFAEQPDDVVFTVEYSVRTAATAVYTLLGLDKKPPSVYKGLLSPEVVWQALRTLHR
jgi:oleate hydratase